MRRLIRLPLPKKVRVWLWRHTRAVLVAEDPKGEASRRWASARPFDQRYKSILRDELKRMAGGIERCMYCEDSAGYPIDHFWPKKRFPERAFCSGNLFLVCDHCNNRCKGQQFPLDERGEPLLIDPTVEDPSVHIALSPHEGRFVPRGGSLKGKTTIELLPGKSPHSAAVFSGKLNMKARRQEDFPEILLPVFPPSCEFSKNLRGCLRAASAQPLHAGHWAQTCLECIARAPGALRRLC